MRIVTVAIGLGSYLAVLSGGSLIATPAAADPAEHTYVACNQYNECWRVHERYAYGRASLLHYARWMADNEYPYLDKPEILEYPNETWAASPGALCVWLSRVAARLPAPVSQPRPRRPRPAV